MRTPPPFSSATIFCMWGRTMDVIKHARFKVNRFRGFGAPGGRKWPSPIDLAHRPYNSVRTNVLHCDLVICLQLDIALLIQNSIKIWLFAAVMTMCTGGYFFPGHSVLSSPSQFCSESLFVQYPALCGLRGCKNGPALFPGRMSYKATKPGLVFVLYLSIVFYCVSVY